jgi:acid phosphatase
MYISARTIVFSLTTSSFEGPQVRLVLNGATFPLSICEQSEEDREYGTCSLDEFVRANNYSMSVEYKSEIWNATCGVPPSR